MRDVTLDADAPTPAHETALACLRDAVEAVLPYRVVRDSVSLDGETLTVADESYDLGGFDRIVVVGGGKAANGVADALEAVLGERIDAGAVVTPNPEDSGESSESGESSDDGGRIERLPGDHPVPSQRGVESSRRLVEILDAADERTLVLAAITGGGSAVIPTPAEGISLSDLRTTTDELLRSGADISELNAVRKHLSTLKGGGLAERAAPATVVGLMLSDVVGNDLGVIASGPTAPDETTYDDALSVLDRYDLSVPESVRDRLERGAAGEVPETPTRGDAVFERVHNHILADGHTALSAARDAARERGYDALVLSSRVRGEAREAAKTHAAVAEEAAATGDPLSPPAVVLSGGECTVTVRGDGEGGPNLEFCLSAARELDARAVVAALDSDGEDGGTTVAGAIVDDETVESGDEAAAALAENDALPYLRDRGALIRTGPTGTNVNDLRVVVVGGGADDAGGD
ncbi:glycerate kinase type-2 family protein [Halopelagius fulvigenes]|uniref:Glycerate kinase n=1 Tax=Halopelagius fulvigenes TaxID=1198324 RepID=A0ABD5TXX0_9EURY